MTKDQLKQFCRDEFGMTIFTNPEEYTDMKKVFGISGRTFVSWMYERPIQKHFVAMAELYISNKKLKSDNAKLSEALVQLNKRVENLKPTS